MIIKYFGHSCFLIETHNKKFLFDPFDPKMVGYPLKKQRCDYCCISHGHADHNFVSAAVGSTVIDSPTEKNYEDFELSGYSSFHDNAKGLKRGKNIIYKLTSDGFSLVHMGDIGFIDYSLIEKIKGVDALAIPVGGNYTINAEEAAEYIEAIKPKFVLPMHYYTEGCKIDIAPPDEFLKKFKENKILRLPCFDTDTLPCDYPTIIMLDF